MTLQSLIHCAGGIPSLSIFQDYSFDLAAYCTTVSHFTVLSSFLCRPVPFCDHSHILLKNFSAAHRLSTQRIECHHMHPTIRRRAPEALLCSSLRLVIQRITCYRSTSFPYLSNAATPLGSEEHRQLNLSVGTNPPTKAGQSMNAIANPAARGQL